MKIETEYYLIDFPKYAKKIKTELIPTNQEDAENITDILDDAKIKFEKRNNSLGIYGHPLELAQKLRKYIIHSNKESKYHSIASRLNQDMQFRALIG